MTDLRRSGRRNVKIVLLFISFVLFPFRIEEDCTWVVVFVCLLFVMVRVGSGRVGGGGGGVERFVFALGAGTA